MTCPKCEECRNLGYHYCSGCGEALILCPECEKWRASGATFCGACGTRLRNTNYTANVRKPLSTTDALRGAATVSCIFVAILMIAEFIAVITKTGEVFDIISAGCTNAIILLVPQLVYVTTISGIALDIYWVFILAMFIASVIWVFARSTKLFNKDILHNPDAAEETPLYWISLLFGSIIIMELAIIFVESMLGYGLDVPDGLPEGATGLSVLAYVDAGVWEELVSRVVWIGLPMMIIAVYKKNPQPWKYLMGGFGFSKASVALIIISTMVFAFAHADGWGFAKVPLVVFGGLVMGYLYTRFGLLASIFYHSLTDLMTCAISISPFWGSISYLLILLIGLVCIADIVRRLPKAVKSIKTLPTMDDGQDNNFFKRS